jgi:hypothetical protein
MCQTLARVLLGFNPGGQEEMLFLREAARPREHDAGFGGAHGERQALGCHVVVGQPVGGRARAYLQNIQPPDRGHWNRQMDTIRIFKADL